MDTIQGTIGFERITFRCGTTECVRAGLPDGCYRCIQMVEKPVYKKRKLSHYDYTVYDVCEYASFIFSGVDGNYWYIGAQKSDNDNQ